MSPADCKGKVGMAMDIIVGIKMVLIVISNI